LELIQPTLLPPKTADWLEGLPDAGVEDRLLAARLRLAALPVNERESLLSATVQRFQAGHLEPLAAWLFGLNRPDTVLSLIDEARGQSSASLFALRLRAIKVSQGPAAALVWLEAPCAGVDRTELLLTRRNANLSWG